MMNHYGKAWFSEPPKVGGTGYDDPEAVEVGSGGGSGGGSAGGGFFVVNLNFEYNEETDTETVTADKTFQDIVNAADAGLFPVAIFVSRNPTAGNFNFNVYNLTYLESSGSVTFSKAPKMEFFETELIVVTETIVCTVRNEWSMHAGSGVIGGVTPM